MRGFIAIIIVALCLSTSAQGQSWNQADSFAALATAWAAYCPSTGIQSWSCFWCTYSGAPSLTVTAVPSDSGSGAQGFVGYDGTTIWVSFRGTVLGDLETALENLAADLTASKISPWSDASGVGVHQGFYNTYSSIAASIRSGISTANSQCSSCSRIIFTGHSLGAAMAQFAAVEFARSPISGLNAQLITVGSPRAGNSGFASYVASLVPNNIRWTHTTDPIVHLPPSSLGYRHSTREVWQTSSGYNTCSATNGEDSSCADSVSTWDLLEFQISNHMNYGGWDLHNPVSNC